MFHCLFCDMKQPESWTTPDRNTNVRYTKSSFLHSSDVVKKMAPAVGQQGPQAPPLGVQGGCAPGLGCVSPITGRTRTILPVPFRPAWTLPMLRQLTETADSRHWHRSLSEAPCSCACRSQSLSQDTALLFVIVHTLLVLQYCVQSCI